MKNKKDLYMDCKQALQARRENTKYFNRAFFNTFVKCCKDRANNIKNNIDDSYFKDYVLLFRSYDAVYNSAFYNKNSGAYCEFLSVFNDLVTV